MRHVFIGLAALLLAACGSIPTGPSWDSDVDYAKVNAIERAAAQNGVKVYWITVPRKTVKKDRPGE